MKGTQANRRKLMDTLSFIAEIVTALIWPVTALIIVLLLRTSILELIPRLSRLSVGEVELEFDEQLAEVAAQAEIADLPPDEDAPVLRSASNMRADRQPFPEASKVVYPKGAILEAWEAIEGVLDEKLSRTNRPQPRSARSKVQQLALDGALDGQKLKMLIDLWGLRNMAAHEKEFQPTAQQAAAYSQLADRLIKAMEES